MYLPNSVNAVISHIKITDYLLNLNHETGGSKASFFRNFGFNENNTDDFEIGLLNIAKTNKVFKTVSNPFGIKYIIEGVLKFPNGRIVEVTTIWFIENRTEIPKLVTAYPK